MARRVVTSTAEDGSSYFLFDGPAPVTVHQAGRGLTFHELWVTDGPLASIAGEEDDGARPFDHHPPPGGTRIRMVEFLPDDEHDRAALEYDVQRMGDSDVEFLGSDDPTMHRNQTVDYNIIVSGEIYAVTDAGEVLLRAGDVLVQRGTSHTWRNRSGEPCVYASIMVSAEPLPARSAS